MLHLFLFFLKNLKTSTPRITLFDSLILFSPHNGTSMLHHNIFIASVWYITCSYDMLYLRNKIWPLGIIYASCGPKCRDDSTLGTLGTLGCSLPHDMCKLYINTMHNRKVYFPCRTSGFCSLSTHTFLFLIFFIHK